ncbi:GNAT family N-acetyltransferase [Flagellimonas okinawensis]|uniref:GNAT family N-acetyltransferase n=1 Tax=Flagellimonas okinawensis TaxID=3031324 RepID=A0ABT5XJ21_9FLAO|nr:GNAT family N-acetyltransferase [[Muricauda] okinawensis]MDF0705883.1 GNAT family N-acetyltransferase [[Muricauda] okinawensis]
MIFRKASTKDLPIIVEMIADDPLGSKRENYTLPLPKTYYDALERITSDKNQELMVVENKTGNITAVFQMSFIPYLTYQGGIRAQIEGVRVHKAYRNQGIGKLVMEWAIRRAKEKNAHVLQLTTDKNRPDAIRFYESLGFTATHEGMKLHF